MTEPLVSPEQQGGGVAQHLVAGSPYPVSLWVAGEDATAAAGVDTGLQPGRIEGLESPHREPDGRVRFDLLLSKYPHYPLQRLLSAWQRAGVVLLEGRWTDLVTDISDEVLDRLLGEAWDTDDGRRRWEALGGPAVLVQLLERVTQLPPKNHLRWTAAGAMKHVVLNSPDLPVSERLVEVVSAAAPDIKRSDYIHQPLEWLLNAVKLGAELANVEWGSVPTDELVWPLAAHPASVFRWPACDILAALPGTRSPQATQALVELGHQYATKTGAEAGVIGESVAGALGACPDVPEVRAALHLLRRNKQAPVRNQAQWSLARVGGRDAVAEFWEELAGGRSSYDAELATQLVAKYGTVDDVPLAIRLLDRATRPTSPQWEPVPWGATMLQFLDRHSGRPEAGERLRRFTREFAKGRPPMQAWVRANLPHLAAPTEPDADIRIRS